jgi:thiamine biosynthesis lipoprotein ApbE
MVMISIDEINKLQAQNKGLIEQNRQLQQDITTLQGKLDAFQMSENEANEIIAELKAENDRQKEKIKQLEVFIKSDSEIDHINHEYTYKLKQTLQEIKKICKNSHTSASEDYYRTADKIMQKITKAEEE